jgi:hypothetical protein
MSVGGAALTLTIPLSPGGKEKIAKLLGSPANRNVTRFYAVLRGEINEHLGKN